MVSEGRQDMLAGAALTACIASLAMLGIVSDLTKHQRELHHMVTFELVDTELKAIYGNTGYTAYNDINIVDL